MSELLKLPTDEIRIVVPGKDAPTLASGSCIKDEDAARGDKGPLKYKHDLPDRAPDR